MEKAVFFLITIYDSRFTNLEICAPYRFCCGPELSPEPKFSFLSRARAGFPLNRSLAVEESRLDRRRFIKAVAGSAAAISALSRKAFGLTAKERTSRPAGRQEMSKTVEQTQPVIKFAAIGLNH